MDVSLGGMRRRLREVTAARMHDVIDTINAKPINDEMIALLLALCDNCSWLLRDWPSQTVSDVETLRESRRTALEKLQLLLKLIPVEKSDSDVLIVLLSGAISIIAEQWMGGETDASSIDDTPQTPIHNSFPHQRSVSRAASHLEAPEPAPLVVPKEEPAGTSSYKMRSAPSYSREHTEVLFEKTPMKTEEPEEMEDEEMASFLVHHEEIQHAANNRVDQELTFDDLEGYNVSTQPSTSHVVQPMPSSVWNLFDKVSTMEARCHLCPVIVRWNGSSTSNLWEHLRKHHPAEHARRKKTKVPVVKGGNQGKIWTMFDKQTPSPDGDTFGICRLCSEPVVLTGLYTNALWNHLNKRHKRQHDDLKRARGVSTKTK